MGETSKGGNNSRLRNNMNLLWGRPVARLSHISFLRNTFILTA